MSSPHLLRCAIFVDGAHKRELTLHEVDDEWKLINRELHPNPSRIRSTECFSSAGPAIERFEEIISRSVFWSEGESPENESEDTDETSDGN